MMSSLRIFTGVAILAIGLLASNGGAHATALHQGLAIGPGVGNQVHAFAFDPGDVGVAYAGGDVCGVYKYNRTTGEWSPWSHGLGFGDLNMAFYVDDLLVVRSPDPAVGPRQGVYAATLGGIWFRGFNDDGRVPFLVES